MERNIIGVCMGPQNLAVMVDGERHHASTEQVASLIRQVNVRPIYNALKNGNDEKAHLRFIEVEPVLTQFQRDRVIRKASRHGRIDFLRRHVDDTISSEGKQIALYAASAWGQTETCRFWVLDEHLDVHAKPTRFKNPYPSISLRHCHVDTAEFFFGLDKALIEEPDGYHFDRPIHVVNIVQSIEGIKLLAKLHANLDSKTAGMWRQSSLHIDAYYGNMEAGKLMLELGASPNTRDMWGRHPLDVARIFKQRKFVGLLREFGGVESTELIPRRKRTNGLLPYQKRRISYETVAREYASQY